MIQYVKKTIDDVNVQGKRVLLRAEFNVPLDKKTGEITDDKRIRAAIPTIRTLVERGARLIIVSHLGRPKGFDPKLSLRPVAERLSELLERPVTLAEDVVGEDAQAKAAALRDGEILLLENVRYHKEETKNKPAFARALASMAELYVSDAFGAVHRAHASTAGVASFLPGVAGYTIDREIEMIGQAMASPKRPLTAILGGAKVYDKIGVIRNLIDNVDNLLIGGGMAYTFIAALGHSVGNSLCETDKIDLAKELMELAEKKGVRLVLPIDVVAADTYAPDATSQVVAADQIPDDWEGLDAGPKTIERFSEIIRESGTVIWNGPVGVFEFDAFGKGTAAIAKAIAESDAVSIVGGGDTAAAVEKFGYTDGMTHVSTGGGASLEYLEGKVLPGIDCLQDRDPRARFVAGNWKMNKAVPAEATALIDGILKDAYDVDARLVVAVPYTALAAALDRTAGTPVHVAAQNGYSKDAGAYTGEIAMATLAEMHVPYVVIGHSERRAMAGETDQCVNRKLHAALHWGIRPIVCIGESKQERADGVTKRILSMQLEHALDGVPAEKLCQMTIAYEPIWAIGTGDTATAEQAEAACAFIADKLADMYGESAERVKILYGGSIQPENASELFAGDHVDGGLVGGASLEAESFIAIAKA
ncbi:MAG: triose-phosphate isomerase [Saccharofermentanales bacterium]|jgi:triosephosphate isomerase